MNRRKREQTHLKDSEKDSLEKRKLELEILKLNKSLFRDFEFWKIMIPTFAILISLYFTFGRGIIDSEKSKLELQKEQLQFEIDKFEIKKAKLIGNIKEKDSVKIELSKQVNKYIHQKEELINRIKYLSSNIGNSKKQIEILNQEHSKDKTFYKNELKKEYNLEESRLKELERIESEIEKRDLILVLVSIELDFLNSKVKLTKEDESDLRMKQNNAKIKEQKKQSNKYEDKIKALYKKICEDNERIDKMSGEDLQRELDILWLKAKFE